MVCLVVLMAAEGWFVYSGGKQRAQLSAELDQHLSEIDRLQRQKPAPNDENLRRAKEDFEHDGVVLATMLRALNVGGADELDIFKGEPASRTEAFFDIAQSVDRLRKAADEAHIALRPDEFFGFSAYAHEGPDPDLIRAVYRQRRIVEYLLGKLFAARPRALLSVQREEPVRASATPPKPGAKPPAAPAPKSGQADANATGDIFVIDRQVSARTPGYVDTMAFRITFSGQTAALRGFMNALAAPEIPLVVRSVEVTTVSPESQRQGSRPGQPPANLFPRAPGSPTTETTASNVPIVPENEAHFTVTVELFEVKIRPPAVAGTP